LIDDKLVLGSVHFTLGDLAAEFDSYIDIAALKNGVSIMTGVI